MYIGLSLVHLIAFADDLAPGFVSSSTSFRSPTDTSRLFVLPTIRGALKPFAFHAPTMANQAIPQPETVARPPSTCWFLLIPTSLTTCTR